MANDMQRRQTLDDLYTDIVRTAGLVGVTCNKAAAWPVLEAYEEFFTGSAVAFRATSKPQPASDLSVRYLDMEKPHDPYAIAVDHGLYTPQGHPVEAVLPELREHFPMLGYGIDMGVKHGFEKIWPFFVTAISMEQAYTLPSFPASVKAHAEYFARYDLKWFSLMALDYWKKTLNIYFMVNKPGLFPPDKVEGMIWDLGFRVPSAQELEYNSRVVGVYYTFSWDSPLVERMSFGMAAAADQVPLSLTPVYEPIVTQAPFQTDERKFVYATCYTRHYDYYKIEMDYTGTIADALMQSVVALPT